MSGESVGGIFARKARFTDVRSAHICDEGSGVKLMLNMALDSVVLNVSLRMLLLI